MPITRLISHWTTITFFAAAFMAPAAADPVDAYDNWLENQKILGLVEAGYGGIEFDVSSNTITVRDQEIVWRFPAIAGLGSLEARTLVPETRIVGMRETSEGFSYDRYTIAGDTITTATGLDADGTPFTMTVTMSDYEAVGVFQPRLTPVPDDPTRPISKYLHYFDLYTEMVTESMTMGQLAFESRLDQTVNLSFDYKGFAFSDMRDGRIGEARFDSYRQTMIEGFGQPNAGSQAAPSGERTETAYGEVVQIGMDFGAIVAWLDGRNGGPDAEFRPFVEKTDMRNLTGRAGPVEFGVDRYVLDGVYLRPGQNSILALADRQALGETTGEDEILKHVAELASGIALDRVLMAGITGSGSDGENDVSMSMDRFAIKDLSADGLGEFTLKGIEAKGPEDEAFSLGRFTLADTAFPDWNAVAAAIENGPPEDPFAAAALAPRLGRLEIANLEFDDRQRPVLDLEYIGLEMDGFIGGVPTDIDFRTRELNIPTAFITDPVFRQMLEGIGRSALTLSGRVGLYWDEDSETLTLDGTELVLEDGGAISLEAEMRGVPRTAFVSTPALQQALGTIAFRFFEASVTDAEVVSDLIDHFAAAQNMSPGELKSILLRNVDLMAGPLAGTPFIESVRTAVEAFLDDPQGLTIAADPGGAVPLTELLGLAATVPQQIPDRLKVDVTAE
ncbi:MAG: hypothetical protein AAGF59_00195 [Pseudomonadota bacterium]